jgi:hypothetical protein
MHRIRACRAVAARHRARRPSSAAGRPSARLRFAQRRTTARCPQGQATPVSVLERSDSYPGWCLHIVAIAMRNQGQDATIHPGFAVRRRGDDGNRFTVRCGLADDRMTPFSVAARKSGGRIFSKAFTFTRTLNPDWSPVRRSPTGGVFRGRLVSGRHGRSTLRASWCFTPVRAYLGFEPIDPVTSSNSDGSLGRAVAPALDTTAALLIPRSLPRGLFHGAKSIRNSDTIPTTATIAATVTGTTTPGAFFPCACN